LGKNKEIGIKGESIALEYLLGKGYTVLEKNYTFRRLEIDLIAKSGDILVFVEVKTRRTKDFGYPDEAVDARKIDHILDCADHYLFQNQWQGDIRFDIISIIMEPFSIEHIEDAFY